MTTAVARSGVRREIQSTITVTQLRDGDGIVRTSDNPGGFGMHLTLDGYRGDPERLADADHVLACLDGLPERLGMHKITAPFLVELGHHSPKDPGGVSGFVMIAESHVSIHTFPLRGFVSADVYTCQNSLDTDQICRYFVDAFGLQDLEVNLVRRGTRYPQHNIYDPPQKVA
jgi:S-adenosylmethionine decarboxylase